MLNLYRGRIEFCDIESSIRSGIEQQTGILQMTLLRTPEVYNIKNIKIHSCFLFKLNIFRQELNSVGMDGAFAMDEFSILIFHPSTDNGRDDVEVPYELVLFDFLKLHPFIRCCAHCEKTSQDLKRCSRCRKANYCSLECQRNDWKHHKGICTSASSTN